MATHLSINGTPLLPIRVAASETGYARDYITRLAREGKVEATQVGRQWFVDVTSLKHYAAVRALEQKVRQQHLSEARKQERLVSELIEKRHIATKVQASRFKVHAKLTTASLAVLGLLFGYSLVTLPGHTSLLALVSESPLIRELKGDVIPPLLHTAPAPFATSPIPEFVESSVTQATFATKSEGVLLLPAVTSATSVSPTALFSDPVHLVTDSDGNTYVERQAADGQTLERVPYVVVPVISQTI